MHRSNIPSLHKSLIRSCRASITWPTNYQSIRRTADPTDGKANPRIAENDERYLVQILAAFNVVFIRYVIFKRAQTLLESSIDSFGNTLSEKNVFIRSWRTNSKQSFAGHWFNYQIIPTSICLIVGFTYLGIDVLIGKCIDVSVDYHLNQLNDLRG